MSLQAGQAAGARRRAFRKPPPRHRRPPKRRRLVQSAGLVAMGCGVLTTALGLGGWALTGQYTWFGQAGQRASSAHPGQAGAGRVGIRQPGSGGRRRHAGHVAHAVQIPVPLGLTAHAPGGASQRKVPAPVRLVIPAIGVNTRLTPLGITSNDTLQVPVSAAIAGWFTGGPRPGAVGAAIIAGHIDSYSGPRRDPCERIGGQVQDHRGTHLRQEPFSDGQGVRTRARSRAALDYLRRPVRLRDGLVPVERHRLRGPGSASQQAVRHATAMTPMTTDDLTGQVFGAFAPAPGDRQD